MKKRIGMRALSVLLALVLVSVVTVPAVCAQQSDKQQVVQGQDIGVGGMELTHTSSGLSDNLNNRAPGTVYDWRAGTDIWQEWLGPVKSKHYSKSRISGTSTAYDIPKIGVRGRVWWDDDLQFDESNEECNSADASVNYQSSATFLSGYWKAQSDHTFEYRSNNDCWYPVTTDDLDL